MIRTDLRGFGRLLWRLADLVQAAERRRSFRSKAYRRAVWSLDDLTSIDAPEDELLATPGIGPGVASLLDEYRTTGGMNHLTTLEQAYPNDVARLRRLPRMTPKMLRDLKDLGIETSADLRHAIESGAAQTLKGAGPQTLRLWERVLDLLPGPGWVPAHQAWVTSVLLANQIEAHTSDDAIVAGPVRRVEELVDRVELVVVTGEPVRVAEFLAKTATLTATDPIEAGVLSGSTHSGIRVEVSLTSPAAAGSALVRATGPKGHVAALVPMNDHPNECDVYRDAGLGWIPPAARALPLVDAGAVVKLHHLRGDLHIHSDASPDGRMSLRLIAQQAIALGYEYVLITDHTAGLRFGGLDGSAIAVQSEAVDQLRSAFPSLTILHGAELNIDHDGSLDIDDAALELIDFAIAGVHSHFGLGRANQTERVVTALSHTVVRVLAHPFGRRIGIRPALDIDMEAIIDAAVENGVALETNGHRDRLDLPAEWVRRAASSGAIFAANSDAHRIEELSNVTNAVATLQRAGIGAAQVVNTLPVAQLLEWSRAEVATRRSR